MGVGRHGGNDAPGRGRTRGREAVRRHEARHGAREGRERQAEGRDAATVGSRGRVDEASAAHFRLQRPDAALHRMVGLDVSRRRLAHVAGGREHGGMLARAVVVEAAEGRIGAKQAGPRRRAQGRVGAAFEIGFAEPHAPEPGGDRLDMGALAIVGSAGERDLGPAHRESIGGTGLDERQRLQRLDGRARIDRPRDVAPSRHDPPVGTHDRGGTAMAALDHVAAGELDEDRVGGRRDCTVVGYGGWGNGETPCLGPSG